MKDKNEIPQTNIVCPVCHGDGKLTEDSQVYEFITRDPQTNTCLVCGGRGHVYPTKKLPNGHSVSTLATRQKKLNVSRKAVGIEAQKEEKRKRGEESHEEAYVEAQKEEERESGEGPFEGWEAFRDKNLDMLKHEVDLVTKYNKGWVFVSSDDPIYLEVSRLFRRQRISEGKWSEEDEYRYKQYCTGQIEKIMEAIYG